jgi:2-polyprenyl-3-methyl-5-hydroxy-6-metoxy-1,4-benzoquinol methylase
VIRASLKDLRLVDRIEFLKKRSRGKRVLHLGATDAPGTDLAIRNGRFLHSKLKEEAAHLVGLDNNVPMIIHLQKNHGFEGIYSANVESAGDYPDEEYDLVIAGEILEHLSNPGRALDAARTRLSPCGEVVITAPNANSLKVFLRAVMGYELIHPDHVLHHSLRTLTALAERHNFKVISVFSFVNEGKSPLSKPANFLIGFLPRLADGIGVVCIPKEL